MAAPDPDVLLSQLTLRGPANSAKLIEAISAPPELNRTIDGATTLSVDVRDGTRTLLRSGMFDVRSFAVVDGINFELVQVRKAGDRLSLVFEDAIVAALRRRNTPRTFAAGSATRQQIAQTLAAEAGVRITAAPEFRAPVAAAVERSATGQEPSNSWEVLGTLAEDIHWRRFSDGTQLLFGSDNWLINRTRVIRLRERVDAVGDVDFDLDTGKPIARATVTLDTTRWSIPPGQQVSLDSQGPASGAWLVESFTRKLTRTTGTLELVRPQRSLIEPPPAAGAEDGDQGDPDFLPGTAPVVGGASTATPAAGAAAGGGGGLFGSIANAVSGIIQSAGGAAAQSASSGQRERMLAYALAQRGKPYVWGTSGPRSFDCSGLVQEATRAAGKVLPKPVSSQWAKCRADGKTISVEQAMRTRGALLFHLGADGSNHIAFSLGDGNTMEARGPAYGTNVFKAATPQSWYTGGALWL